MKLRSMLDFLNSKYKEDWNRYAYTYFFGIDEPTKEEAKEFGADSTVLCFRTFGYTIGHLIAKPLPVRGEFNYKIVKIVVYSAGSENQFILTPLDMEKELEERFLNQDFDIEELMSCGI